MTRELARSPEELIEYFKEMQRAQPNLYILIAPNGDVYIEDLELLHEIVMKILYTKKFSIEIYNPESPYETVKASAEEEGKASN